MSARMFELVEGTSKKFWEIAIEGSEVCTRYGKIGTQGQTTRKDEGTADKAQKLHDKLIAEKRKKGYVELQAGAPSGAGSAPARAEPSGEPATIAQSTAVDAMLSALRRKHAHLAAQLRPGASEADLGLLGALHVPPAFLALYAAHDGSEAELFGSFRLLPVADIQSERETMNELLARTPEWQASGRWNDAWVPFLADGDGQYYVLDPVGALEGGAPGNILGYDHESGPARELASFDVLLDLFATLAKKGLLTEEAQENEPEKYEEAYASAQAVGLAKMPPKELKKAKEALANDKLGPEDKLRLALPLVRRHGAERELWSEVLYAAKGAGQWALMAKAAASTERLTPARDRPFVACELVLALHRSGRDKEALSALEAALRSKTQYARSQIPDEADAAFRHRCFVTATALRPSDMELWLGRGQLATDRDERRQAFEKTIELSHTPEGRGRGAFAAVVRKAAERWLELDRIDGLEGKARLEALWKLAESLDDFSFHPLDKHHADTWVRVARRATEDRDWAAAEKAGDHVLKLLYKIPTPSHLLAGFRILALHKLRRDEEARALLKEVLEAIYDNESPEALETLESIPWNDASGAEERAFEASCLELAVTIQPENMFLWNRRALRAASAAERRSALEKVVALGSAPERADYVPNPHLAYQFRPAEDAKYAAFRRLRTESEARLARGELS
jgi:predicted DNA-binding WGR domain protein/cell wall assembly regulator SMI1